MGGIETYRACVAGREIVICGNDVKPKVAGGRGTPGGRSTGLPALGS